MKTSSLRHVPVFCGRVTSCSDFFRAALVFTKSLSLTKKMQNTTRSKAQGGGKKASVDVAMSKMRVAVSVRGDQHLLFRSCPASRDSPSWADKSTFLLLAASMPWLLLPYIVPKGVFPFCALASWRCSAERNSVWVKVSNTLPAQLSS